MTCRNDSTRHSARFVPCLLLAGAAASLAACSEGSGPDGASATLSFSTSVAPPAAAPAVRAAVRDGALFDLEYGDGVSNLTITRVALVLREVELERQDNDSCDDGADSNDDCEEFEAGPVILEFPVDGSVTTVVNVPGVPAGVYDELQFEIHKPEDDSSEDQAFLAANPQFSGVSIRVEGSFDGSPFIYLTDLNAEHEVSLSPPLEVGGGDALNVTLQADVSTWFRDAAGSLIDPTTANAGGVNEAIVEDNIQSSFDSFEDDDMDGDDDNEMEGDN